MAFIPRHNAPQEMKDWANWVQKRDVDQDALLAEHDRLLKMLSGQNNAGARQTTVVNNIANRADAAVGLPVPAVRGAVLRGTGDAAVWSREWQGLMPEYFVSLDAAGGSYFVTKVGLSSDSVTDAALSKALLPPVVFDDGGRTMLPIETEVGSVKVHTPAHLYVSVNPSFDGEEFTIYLPPFDNGFGPSTPFYTFKLENIGAFSAVVNIEDTDLIYEGTLEPVLGDVDSWTIAPAFGAAWSVRNILGGGAIAAPAVYWDGGAAVFYDDYYQTNVYTP